MASGFYYGLLLLYRNGLIALLPVLLVKLPEVQVPFMGMVLLSLGREMREAIENKDLSVLHITFICIYTCV